MRVNDRIKMMVEENRSRIFEVDQDYWNGESSNAEQKAMWGDRMNDPITYDGVICNGEDEKCDILYLLKESTCSGYHKYQASEKSKRSWFPKERTWDFIQMTIDIINDKNLRIEKIWPELCCWTELYRNSEKPYLEMEKKYYQKYENEEYEILKNIAIVNIKKTAGESSSKDDLLTKAANTYGDLIKKEIELIDPEIIFCGDTFEQARLIFGKKGSRRNRLDCGTEYFIANDGDKEYLFVDFYHPSAGIKKAVLYTYAKEVFKDLKKAGLIK